MCSIVLPADASAKSLGSLTVTVEVNDEAFYRDVEPVGDATLAEIVAAMKDDSDFRDPRVQTGELTRMDGGKCILLAHYSTGDDELYLWGEITEVTANYDDDTSETIAL